MDALLRILEELRPDVDFVNNQKKLVDQGVIDSFDMLQLITMLNEEFSIKIRPQDILPENFNSLDAMLALIDKKMNE